MCPVLHTWLLPRGRSLLPTPFFCPNHVLLIKEALVSKKRQEQVCYPVTVIGFLLSPCVYTVVPLYSQGLVPESTVDGPKVCLDSTEPYVYVFTYICITFHLKEALYGFSLAHPNCQHHYSCALGTLLS